METRPDLRRSVSLPLLTLYGLGTIIGAGIYVLIGEVVGRAGSYAPLAFLLAAAIASLTAFSYAELSSRHPRSAGEAAYTQEAFAIRWLSSATGWAVIAIGIVSSATIARGFVGYLGWFVQFPGWAVIMSLLLLLAVVAIWGITQSLWVAAVATVVEMIGLALVIGINVDVFASLPHTWPELFVVEESTAWIGIVLGAFLAFYAFIGFEDMVNIAEEVKEVRRVLPRAIILALVISSLLYLLIAVVAVLALPADTLKSSKAPLSELVAAKSGSAASLISLISLVAVVNGALAQIIMASRVVYGMGRQGLAPSMLAVVHPGTRTPVIATVFVTGLAMLFALWLPLVRLAEITSFVTLVIFALMHVSLVRLKIADPMPAGAKRYPMWIPVTGIISIVALLTFQIYRATL